VPTKPIRNKNKCGRNEKCPCGSDKKVKKCCKMGKRVAPRMVIAPRQIPSNTDFVKLIGPELLNQLVPLLVNNNVPAQLVYLFYKTGTVFSEYNMRFLTDAVIEAASEHIREWLAMSEEAQQLWLNQWKETTNDDAN
jgi:hypothetical protein